MGLKYRIDKNQSFLLSGGKYHNYSTPNYYSKKFALLSSYQFALDYSFQYKNISLTAATYYKNEKGKQTIDFFYSVDNQSTFGIELFYEQSFRRYFKLTFSNTFMNQTGKTNNTSFKGEKDFNYFIKTSLNYNNPKKEGLKSPVSFIEQFIIDDLKGGKNNGRIHTRFPPEPNGYLHIGHAKAICLDFGMALKYGGKCNLRFDDTNPVKEEVEYIDSIKEDIRWLGFDWEKREFYASDYFGKLFDFAVDLVKRGLAYVDDQQADVISLQKGTPSQPGQESPFRKRPVDENLDLFYRMNEGEFEEGDRVLRAKIDMASPNMHFRDPIIYRILKTPHHRTGDKWKVYPM